MNIITGIDKVQVKTSEWVILLGMFFTVTILTGEGCASGPQTTENGKEAKSDVEVSSPIIRPARRQVSFQGVTRYMQVNDIRSQITGIIIQVNCAVAGNISVNQALITVQPQEAAALQKSKFGDQILTGLSDTVFSHLNGQIKKLNVAAGDFVQAGDVLVSCIRTNSMKILVYIPVEQIPLIEKIKDCSVILPDGTSVNGLVSGKLPVAEAQDQTQAYIITPKKPLTLSENINLNVQFTAKQIQEAVFVPEGAVLGNEEQTSFWVMKLMNDSTCTKVPVEKGLKMDSLVQLIGSGLTINDLVISEGAYGLPDSARVQVTNKR